MTDLTAIETNSLGNQHIRDLKLVIEYKHCIKNAPGGVYIIPEFDDLRKFHGVIFIRRGLYRNGIFRFCLRLPTEYNSINSHPEVNFTPPVFNPFIDSKTGILDLKLDPALSEWKPEKHFITTALTSIKKIFYMKSFDEFENLPNQFAKLLFANDKEKFLSLVSKAVEDSLHRVYLDQPSHCTIAFTEPKPVHDVIREKIFQNISSSPNISSSSLSDRAGTGHDSETDFTSRLSNTSLSTP